MVSRYGQEALGAKHDQLTADQVAQRWNVYHADGVTPLANDDLQLLRVIYRGETVKNVELVHVNGGGGGGYRFYARPHRFAAVRAASSAESSPGGTSAS